jgi:hypothetical protein
MRTALLTTALMLATMGVWAADEPTSADAKPQATAETAPAKPAEQATANAATTASIATEDDKPFKPPQGYRPKRINGEQVYCVKRPVLGSRFPKEDCRNEAELRELVRNKEQMKNDMDRTRAVCASDNGACGLN